MPQLPFYDLENVFGFQPKDFYQTNSSKEEKAFREALLVLALIFNDLKDLTFLLLRFDSFAPPNRKSVTRYNGQFSAMHLHIQRVIIGTFFEVLEFIQSENKVLRSERFDNLVSKLKKHHREKWLELLDLAESKHTKAHPLYQTLLLLRNNLGFHYSGPWLGQGFNHFFPKRQSECCMSPGETWSKTRFYFADAAVQGKIMQFVPDWRSFHDTLGNYVGELAGAIGNILMTFFREERIPLRKTDIPQGP